MRLKAFLFCVMIVSGCIDKGVVPIVQEPIPSDRIRFGTYRGTFSLTLHTGTDSACTLTNAATFTFADTGWYTCRQDSCGNPHCVNPPRGGGWFDLKGDSITFIDTVPHTADFDWSLIVGGTFGFRMSSDSLYLSQDDLRLKRFRRVALKRVEDTVRTIGRVIRQRRLGCHGFRIHPAP